MTETILQRMSAVLNALNNISVSGKQNLGNLAGSIAALEELYNTLSYCQINTKVEPEQIQK